MNINFKHAIDLEGVKNARQLGGYIMKDNRKIKQNMLLRTAALLNLTKKDKEKLQNEFHISVIYDLRSNVEAKYQPDPTIDGIECKKYDLYENMNDLEMDEVFKKKNNFSSPIDLYIELAANPLSYDFMKTLYDDLMISKKAISTLKYLFQDMLRNEGKPMLWHCAQGKDRCGVVSAIILFALGADRETVVNDYHATNLFYESELNIARKVIKERNYDERSSLCLLSMIGTPPSLFETTLDNIDKQFGSMDNYLHEAIGLSDEKISKLKDWYLE